MQRTAKRRWAMRVRLLCAACLLCCVAALRAQQGPEAEPASAATGSVSGVVTDTAGSAVPTAQITLEPEQQNEGSAVLPAPARTGPADDHGVFSFADVPEGRYIVRISAPGFASWKIKEVLVVHEGEAVVMPAVQLGVEGISTTVNAITVEDLAERQITAEVHQRILGVLPNFYVSYAPDAAPLTRKQKFKLAVHVSADPVTYLTTGITAGIEQWQGDYAGYGQGFAGYSKRYAATYGDRLSATFLGAAALPSLLHQDPRYFYRGHGRVITRAFYAISTVAVCKGDNGKWQPNFSNIGGNVGAGLISSLYYPDTDRHDVQVTVDNTLLGVAEGAIGTLFQEFLLHRFTHGAPKQP
jgi:hypothetical protein